MGYQVIHRSSLICQQIKTATQLPMGLLQPLPLPQTIWEDMSVDFIIGLPLIHGKSITIVLVDRLSKYYNLGDLAAGYTGSSITDFFMDFPSQSYRTRIELLWKQSGTTLKLSTTYHLKRDGQIEAVNKTIEGYLCATNYTLTLEAFARTTPLSRILVQYNLPS